MQHPAVGLVADVQPLAARALAPRAAAAAAAAAAVAAAAAAAAVDRRGERLDGPLQPVEAVVRHGARGRSSARRHRALGVDLLALVVTLEHPRPQRTHGVDVVEVAVLLALLVDLGEERLRERVDDVLDDVARGCRVRATVVEHDGLVDVDVHLGRVDARRQPRRRVVLVVLARGARLRARVLELDRAVEVADHAAAVRRVPRLVVLGAHPGLEVVTEVLVGEAVQLLLGGLREGCRPVAAELDRGLDDLAARALDDDLAVDLGEDPVGQQTPQVSTALGALGRLLRRGAVQARRHEHDGDEARDFLPAGEVLEVFDEAHRLVGVARVHELLDGRVGGSSCHGWSGYVLGS